MLCINSALLVRLAIGCCLILNQAGYAADYASFTMDNDILVGSDDGYTNGLYYSWYYVSEDPNRALQPKILVKPLLWSLSDAPANITASAYSVGQAMITPEDITQENPDPNDLPYSGLLEFTYSYLNVYDHYADKISTSIGIVGPESGAKSTQKFVHDLLGADDPKGWSSQLNNEVVFQFSRSRAWRSWVSGSERFDILLGAEAALGTLESSVGSGAMLRVGSGLSRSYPSVLLINSRTTNPVAEDGGWFAYLGIRVRYTFNQIFTDGNTFTDSPATELDHTQVGATAGFSHAWENFTVTLAVEDLTLFENRFEGVSRFGTITLGWKL